LFSLQKVGRHAAKQIRDQIRHCSRFSLQTETTHLRFFSIDDSIDDAETEFTGETSCQAHAAAAAALNSFRV
jgi:hypothetical protein